MRGNSAQRAMVLRNNQKLRAGLGRAQTAERCAIGAGQRAEVDALFRRAHVERELSRRQQRERLRAERAEGGTRAEEPHRVADEERDSVADDVADVGRDRVADDAPKLVAGERHDTVEELPTLEGVADDLADGQRDRAAEFTLAFWPESEEAVADEEHRRVAVERCQRQARAASERAERAQRKALLDEDEDDAMVDTDILGSGGDPTLDTPYA